MIPFYLEQKSLWWRDNGHAQKPWTMNFQPHFCAQKSEEENIDEGNSTLAAGRLVSFTIIVHADALLSDDDPHVYLGGLKDYHSISIISRAQVCFLFGISSLISCDLPPI